MALCKFDIYTPPPVLLGIFTGTLVVGKDEVSTYGPFPMFLR